MNKLFKILIFLILQITFVLVFTNFNFQLINPINGNVIYGISSTSNSVITFIKEAFNKPKNDISNKYYLNNIKIFKNTTNKRHFADDGYYYGQKGQCVEFVKRYYHDYMNHDFPNGWGNAKDFFNSKTKDGNLNKERGMFQFINGSYTKPKINDIIIFNNSYYGHVAIIAKIKENSIIIKQQNCINPTKEIPLINNNSRFYINYNKCQGWLSLNK